MLEILQELTFQLRNSSQPQFLLELTFYASCAWRFRQHFLPALFQRLEELEEKLQAAAQLPIATAKVKEAGTVKEEAETETKNIRQYSGETSRGTAETAPPGQKNAATGQRPSVAREPVFPMETTETAETAAEPAEPVEIAESKTTEKIETAETGTLPDGAAASRFPLAAGTAVGRETATGTSPVDPRPPVKLLRAWRSAPPEEATRQRTPGRLPRSQGAELQEFWENSFCPRLKTAPPCSPCLAAGGQPLSCKGGIFTFAFPPTHGIHKSRTSHPAQKISESLLSTMLGTKTNIRIMLQENEKKENSRESAGENQPKQPLQTISSRSQKDSPKVPLWRVRRKRFRKSRRTIIICSKWWIFLTGSCWQPHRRTGFPGFLKWDTREK